MSFVSGLQKLIGIGQPAQHAPVTPMASKPMQTLLQPGAAPQNTPIRLAPPTVSRANGFGGANPQAASILGNPSAALDPVDTDRALGGATIQQAGALQQQQRYNQQQPHQIGVTNYNLQSLANMGQSTTGATNYIHQLDNMTPAQVQQMLYGSVNKAVDTTPKQHLPYRRAARQSDGTVAL